MSKKILIISPKYGLCNQLSSISKGIIYAFLSNRNIIFNGFQLDYRDSNSLVDFHEIIDIKELQKTINKYNLNITVESNRNIFGKKIYTHDDTDISHISDFIPFLFHENNIDIDILDIGNPISSVIPMEHMKLQNLIESEIKFNLKYRLIAYNIIKQLELKNYICIHLRLEDDAINYMKIKKGYTNVDIEPINDFYKKKYIESLENLKKMNTYNKKIYICTSLGIDENVNNNFYEYIKEHYNLIDKTKIMNINTLRERQCREIYAVIDFIIAKESDYFIGIDWSSFSLQIYNSHVQNGKCAELINMWSEINS